jgi:broad specificity phosphatase PhoE
MRLFLITHAHTEQNRAADASSWSLSESGMAQAEALARQPFWDEVQRLIVSREAKTLLTVRPVLAERQLPVWVDCRFDEVRRTGWTENYVAQVERLFDCPEESAMGWEPAAQALRRFLRAVGDLTDRFAPQTCALVGHGLTLSLYRAYLLRRSRVELTEWRNLSFAAVALVDPLEQKWIQEFRPVGEAQARG